MQTPSEIVHFLAASAGLIRSSRSPIGPDRIAAFRSDWAGADWTAPVRTGPIGRPRAGPNSIGSDGSGPERAHYCIPIPVYLFLALWAVCRFPPSRGCGHRRGLALPDRLGRDGLALHEGPQLGALHRAGVPDSQREVDGRRPLVAPEARIHGGSRSPHHSGGAPVLHVECGQCPTVRRHRRTSGQAQNGASWLEPIAEPSQRRQESTPVDAFT